MFPKIEGVGSRGVVLIDCVLSAWSTGNHPMQATNMELTDILIYPYLNMPAAILKYKCLSQM